MSKRTDASRFLLLGWSYSRPFPPIKLSYGQDNNIPLRQLVADVNYNDIRLIGSTEIMAIKE